MESCPPPACSSAYRPEARSFLSSSHCWFRSRTLLGGVPVRRLRFWRSWVLFLRARMARRDWCDVARCFLGRFGDGLDLGGLPYLRPPSLNTVSSAASSEIGKPRSHVKTAIRQTNPSVACQTDPSYRGAQSSLLAISWTSISLKHAPRTCT